SDYYLSSVKISGVIISITSMIVSPAETTVDPAASATVAVVMHPERLRFNMIKRHRLSAFINLSR
ncbi:MAG TPA: hypothetical protein DHV86_00930, partial [Methylophilaceae bacterium]|nr:hypothetical protein [Methylophilaceae bacterium]